MTDMFLGEMAKMKEARVIGSKEIDAMLGYEQKKQMAGCTDTSCMVSIGGALGVDKILMGSVGKLGASHTINLKLINIKEGNIEEIYSKRIKGGTEEDFLDVIPEALATIFPASAGIWVKSQKGPVAAKKQEPMEVMDLQRKPQAPAPVGEAGAGAASERPYSHAGRFLLAPKGAFAVPSFNAAGEMFVGYGLGKWVELGAVGIFSSSFGGAVRVQSFVWNPDGVLKPFVAVQAPYYQTPDGGMVGIGGAPGVQWDFSEMFGLTAETMAEYYFSAPEGYKSLLVFALIGGQARF
ncbi:MAG: hypothetical protein HY897_13535 [Deltaproteobacteria bacterium]|nr:hypothetical protein [Deltaproteobacteria bacterium]